MGAPSDSVNLVSFALGGHFLEAMMMMAKPAKKSFKVNTLIILFLPFQDEGEAGMLQMISTLLWFCNPEQMSRSLPEVQIFLSIHQ